MPHADHAHSVHPILDLYSRHPSLCPECEAEIVPTKIPDAYLAPRAALEAEIAGYTAQAIGLGRKINEFSTLSIFPPDILVEIMIQYAMLYEEEEDEVTGPDVWLGGIKPYKWLGITHVCYQWRQLALNTPRLWARIAVHGRDKVVREMVVRARNAPLIVKANLTTNMPLIQLFSEIYTKHLNHISTLDIRIRGFTLGELLKSDLPAPFLQSFSFRDVSGGTANWPAIRALFSRDLPSMQRVAIRCEMMYWEPTIFVPTLRELKLETARWDAARRAQSRIRVPGTIPIHPTWSEMYAALRRVPHLRELDLENVFPIDPPGSETTQDPIHLTSLKDLLIFGNAKECSDFLDHVNLPLRCSILVRITMDPGETSAMASPAVKKHLEAWNRTPKRLIGTSKEAESDPLRTLSISPVHAHAVLFRAWPIVLTDPAHVARLPIVQQEKLTLSLISEKVPAAVLLEGFTDALSGATLHTLCVEGMEGITTPIWMKLFLETPNLHMLYISQKSGDHLPAVFSHTDSLQPPRPILPNLKDLLFDEVDFGACLPGESGHTGEFGSRLTRGLAERKRLGGTLAELIITRCFNIRAHELMTVKEYVDLVDWDRKNSRK
ncbi:hypothetical protein EUX98_g4965 [Antrodiella citrinella]|uniref:Uncharacterized protein n=1 Tax=Antrodiella citrinella TaxID=2447956 RepID=A0A4S4MUH8_9APHY|nr:hypothetical protein EUX98_g4965 [Antrodiella citrinella]